MSEREKACEGGQTLPRRHSGEHFEECLHCEQEVRCDMVDSSFWGFKANCKEFRAKQKAEQMTVTERR